MGQHEIAESLTRELEAQGVRVHDFCKVTRTIEIKGPREWVVQTIAKSYVPTLGDYRTLTPGKVISCTDYRAEKVED